MSYFQNLEMLPEDPIFGVIPLFHSDVHENKINLIIGSYKDENGKSFLLPSVIKADATLSSKNLNKEYQAFEGDPLYRLETAKLIFGDNSSLLKKEQVFSAQTIGASGALRIGAELLKKTGIKEVAISSPSWSNHFSLISRAGLATTEYKYYDSVTKTLDFDQCCSSLEQLSSNTAVLFHACCHNPTGIDPTKEQWEILSKLCKKKELLPFFDFAYQGFHKNLSDDAIGIRIFAEDHHTMLVAYSYSKNMGLYGERAGALCVLSQNKETSKKVESHIQQLIRGNYSSPPLYPARLVKTILTTPQLKTEWQNELEGMNSRIKQMRTLLADGLNEITQSEHFSFIKRQCGMFCFLGLNPENVLKLQKNYGIYMLLNSRINIAGLNEHNIHYFLHSLKETIL